MDDGVAAIVATFSGLRDLDVEHYERWFDLGESPQDARRREISVDPVSIAAFVARDGHDELGYSLFAWNGAERDDEALSFNCSFSATSKWVKNRVVFGLPPAWLHDLDRARQALDLVVRVWQPEQANVWTNDNVNLVVADL